MYFDQTNSTAKKSLGNLRKAQKTKPRSPITTGTMKLQRHTLESIVRQFERSGGDEIEACLAAWENHDQQGEPYLTIELSPKFVSPQAQTPQKSSLIPFLEDRGARLIENL
jgi:hypothetical protein